MRSTHGLPGRHPTGADQRREPQPTNAPQTFDDVLAAETETETPVNPASLLVDATITIRPVENGWLCVREIPHSVDMQHETFVFNDLAALMQWTHENLSRMEGDESE